MTANFSDHFSDHFSNQLSDQPSDPLSDHLQRGKIWLETVLRLSGLPVSVIPQLLEAHAPEPEDADGLTSEALGLLTIDHQDLTPEQIQILIGPQGEVIDALQYLASLTLNLHRSPQEQLPFTVDLNAYRSQRREQLQTLAQAAVDQVRQQGGELELKSLSSAERRQVHTLLKEFPDIATYSRGREPDRRLVVCLQSELDSP